MFTNKAKTLRVVNLIMQETGTYNQQFSRPYSTSFDGNTLNSVTERVIDRGNGRIDNAALAGITGTFLTPSSAPDAMIGIANGWNEKRVRFLMEIDCQYQVGGSASSYIQGYTNFPGIGANHSVAPDMEFYINSIITTKKTPVLTPYGVQTFESVTDNSHVLCNNNWSTMNQPGMQRMMRPQDVFCHMQASHIPGIYDTDISSVYDGRTVLRTEAAMSDRVNGLSASYAAKIIDGYVVGNALTSFGQSEANIINRSRSEVSETQASLDPFMSALSNITSSGITNKFRYSDLMKLDPNVDAVSNYVIAGNTQRVMVHQAGQTAGWHGSDRMTLAATILSQSVPAIMMELMINRIIFKSTNYDITGQMQTRIIDGKGFSNMDLTQHMDLFSRRLEKEILQDLTFNNQVSYAIEMRVDLLGETWINISIDGQPAIDYVTPSFCDNLFVPVVTTNVNVVQNLTHDFEALVLNVKEAMGSSQSISIATNV